MYYLSLQKVLDNRTAAYKQLLKDHRKVSDKHKATDAALSFAKSECCSVIITSEALYLG